MDFCQISIFFLYYQKTKTPSTNKAIGKSENVTGYRHNHRKNRQAPKPPSKNNVDLELINSASNLEIRGPQELLLGVPVGLRTQWRHTAEALVTGAVRYEVNVCKASY